MNTRFKFAVAGLLLAALAPAMAQGPDSVSLEYGVGQSTRIARIGAQWQWDRQWLKSDSGQLGGYWDLTAATWRQSRYQNVHGRHQNITDIGLTPVFRYAASGSTGWYGEAGIGAHMLSDLYDNAGHKLSTRFEFGDHIAVGYRFDNAWDASFKVQHFSNGGIKHPNGGVNYLMLRVAKGF